MSDRLNGLTKCPDWKRDCQALKKHSRSYRITVPAQFPNFSDLKKDPFPKFNFGPDCVSLIESQREAVYKLVDFAVSISDDCAVRRATLEKINLNHS